MDNLRDAREEAVFMSDLMRDLDEMTREGELLYSDAGKMEEDVEKIRPKIRAASAAIRERT